MRRLVIISILLVLQIFQVESAKDYLKLPLFGNSSTGYYDVYMVLGGQLQRLTADTGSYLLALQCGACPTCTPGQYPNYEPKNSTTEEIIKCVSIHLSRIVALSAEVSAKSKDPIASVDSRLPMVFQNRPTTEWQALCTSITSTSFNSRE